MSEGCTAVRVCAVIMHLCLEFGEMEHHFKKCVLASKKNCNPSDRTPESLCTLHLTLTPESLCTLHLQPLHLADGAQAG